MKHLERRFKKRKQHRFSRSFIHGQYTFQWPCGIIQGLCFLYDRELDFKEKLDLEELVVPPGSKPYIIGDSECRQVLMGMVGGALYASHGHIINARPRLVDGWHYRAHSKNDPVRARAAARRDNQSGLPLTPKHVTARKHRAEVVSILTLAGRCAFVVVQGRPRTVGSSRSCQKLSFQDLARIRS